MPRRTKSEEFLDFEIHFYERLLTAHPDFSEVLIPLAEAYTRRGLHDKGLQVDLRLTQLHRQDPIAWYNLACSYALLKRLDESLDALHRACELGYADLNHLRRDPDLANIRHSPKYRQLLDAFAALKVAPARPALPHPKPHTGPPPA
ncbi:MAG: hypothetical protein HY598_04525 [Candidatus Omnitrophica bacterium]|nr:hypothetical protein [Candidatus Omnitrophota bacterium]